MSNDIKRLERKIEDLTERLEHIERRVIWGDDITTERTRPVETAATEAVEASPRRSGVHAGLVISLVGRTLIILGGAFLLRFLTQWGTLPPRLGSIVGVLYAISWIVMADINAGRGRRLSAAFHAVTAGMIALPLLVEVTTTLHYLTPTLSAIHLPAFIVLGLAVAWRRNLRVLAWIVTVPAAPVAFMLAVQTDATTPFLVSLLIIGFATLWLSYLRHWHVLATLMAAVVNLGLALMVMEYVVVSHRVDSTSNTALWEVLFLLFGLIALYFGSTCFRVFRRKRTITPIEIGNTLVVLMVGVGGAALAIDASNHSMFPLGIVCAILAVASYGAAYGLLPRLDPNRRNFVFYTLLALAMALLGLEILLPHTAAAVGCAAIALAAGSLAKKVRSPILYLHGAAYLVAAVFGSGLVGATRMGLIGDAITMSRWFHPSLLLALALTVAYPWFPRPEGRARDMALGRRSTDLFVLITVLAVGAFLVSAVSLMSPQGHGSETLRAVLASARTGVLAISAAVLAWYNRQGQTTRFGNLAWLVYTLLAFGAIKLAYEDVPIGGSAVLFLSLALYGGALILAPRMLHGGKKHDAHETPTAG